MFPGNPIPLVSGTMIVLALALAGAFVLAHRRAALSRGAPAADVTREMARAALIAALWIAVFSAAALSGVLARFDQRPPPLNLMMVLVLGGAVSFARSERARAIVDAVPLWALVGVQAFRLPLELAMHEAARAGVMPTQMSFSGWNFDIVTGASAIVVAALVHRGVAPRLLVVVWNTMGALLLANVVTIAVLSTPLVHAFGPGALNTWIAYFPFVLLPGVMVTSAIAGHLLVARWLLRHPAARPAAA